MGCKINSPEDMPSCTDSTPTTDPIKYDKRPEKYQDKNLYEQITEAIGENHSVTANLIVDCVDRENQFYNVYVDGRTLTDEQLLKLVKLRRETNYNMNLKLSYEDYRENFFG